MKEDAPQAAGREARNLHEHTHMKEDAPQAAGREARNLPQTVSRQKIPFFCSAAPGRQTSATVV